MTNALADKLEALLKGNETIDSPEAHVAWLLNGIQEALALRSHAAQVAVSGNDYADRILRCAAELEEPVSSLTSASMTQAARFLRTFAGSVLQAASIPAVPKGYALVPIKANAAIATAIGDVLDKQDADSGAVCWYTVGEEAWRAGVKAGSLVTAPQEPK